ncbi:Rpn family recombination-promoting nuclease/putative transposase [Caloramator sp. CAR-1]|uniref:Rpn family recombination-promoting nuclease/putative transposase n=1 Tax=Caloramator sp. CAR-1 TaxID=3062777 RepID=UPI0026E1FB77|nr:Rpn family recombination-promoting nuclease/putative transposase [Caloramator sp. CAR-1]MDO6355394.1 Rpn family recombination-promoting nuclease/putative transposase [Caloramator sp. CAR-1]
MPNKTKIKEVIKDEVIDKDYEIIPPKIDFVFKHIFGNEKHKQVLVSFLSAVLRVPKEELEGLEILNSELIKNHKKDKKGVLDVRVKTKDEKEIDIEVQILDSGYMAERTLFYWSKMYTGQIEAGGKYTDLKKCITINIVDFNVTPLKKLNSTYHIFEDETNYKLTDVLEIHFLELKKLYDKEVPRDENDPLVMWMEFIDGNKEVIDVLSKKNEDINYAYNLLKIISKDKKARMEYEAKMAAIRDEMTRLHLAEQKGREEGRMEGRVEGKIEGKKEVAERMLRKGIDVETVAEITGLQITDIEEIRKNMLN